MFLPALLIPSFLETIQDRLPISAPIVPGFSGVNLGDYGYYVNGRFIWRGNLFLEHELPAESFTLSESFVKPDQFLLSPNASKPSVQGRVSRHGELYTRVRIEFEKGPGFFMHLQGIRNELFFPDKQIENLIQYLIQIGRWDEQYRLVWQRFCSPSARFGFTGLEGGIIQFVADASGMFQEFEDSELVLELFACTNVYLNAWLEPFVLTPAVNFTRVRTSQEDGMGEIDGFWQEELSAMGASSLVLDNGFSVL